MRHSKENEGGCVAAVTGFMRIQLKWSIEIGEIERYKFRWRRANYFIFQPHSLVLTYLTLHNRSKTPNRKVPLILFGNERTNKLHCGVWTCRIEAALQQ